jgi:hypothetical protein
MAVPGGRAQEPGTKNGDPLWPRRQPSEPAAGAVPAKSHGVVSIRPLRRSPDHITGQVETGTTRTAGFVKVQGLYQGKRLQRVSLTPGHAMTSGHTMRSNYCHNCRVHSSLPDGVHCGWCLRFFYAQGRLPTPADPASEPSATDRLYADMGWRLPRCTADGTPADAAGAGKCNRPGGTALRRSHRGGLCEAESDAEVAGEGAEPQGGCADA